MRVHKTAVDLQTFELSTQFVFVRPLLVWHDDIVPDNIKSTFEWFQKVEMNAAVICFVLFY